MRPAIHPFTKAVTTFAVGMAFFFWGCYPRPALKAPPEKPPLLDAFDQAEQDFRAGEYDLALEKYGLYLRSHPVGEKSRKALYRMASIHYQRQDFEKALPLFERVATEYPAHSQQPVVKYDIASTYYRLGAYERSRDATSEWLKEYPTHPLLGEVLLLAGKSTRALGDAPKALYWWLKALKAFEGTPERETEAADRIIGLVEDSPLEDLQVMAEYAAGSDYLPHVYYHMASIYLERNHLDDARRAAMALVRSTPEQFWVSVGRHILERIEEELSVKKGVIGCLLPLSGPFAIYGEEVLNGIELGMGLGSGSEQEDELELVIMDSEGVEERAVLGVEKLATEEKVMAIIGPLASKPSLAAGKRAQELGVPIITLTQSEGVTEAGEMVFRNFLTPQKEVEALLEMAMGQLGLRRFAILYPDNPYGRYFMTVFWDKAEELGAQIRAVESYKPEETDFAVQIKKMVGLFHPRPEVIVQTLIQWKSMEWENEIEERPPAEVEEEPIVDFEAVFIPDNPQQVALIAPQFPFNNIFHVRLLGTSLWQSDDLIKTAGDYVQGALFPSGFYTGNGRGGLRDFVALYKENFESEPGLLAATGYDTIRFIKEVMKVGAIRTRRDLRYRMTHHDAFQGLMGTISFEESGEVKNRPLLLTVSGKRFEITPGMQ